MAEILPFPTEPPVSTSDPEEGKDHDRFLLDEGLELLGDFRAIEDRAVRESLRQLVKSMALATRRPTLASI